MISLKLSWQRNSYETCVYCTKTQISCNCTVYVAKWNDNAIVVIASNCLTHKPMQTATRRVKGASNATVRVRQPYIISQYNNFMGGVDWKGSHHHLLILLMENWLLMVFIGLCRCSIQRKRTWIGDKLGPPKATVTSQAYKYGCNDSNVVPDDDSGFSWQHPKEEEQRLLCEMFQNDNVSASSEVNQHTLVTYAYRLWRFRTSRVLVVTL